ncbi:MAG: excinuclease ABC subunit C [Bacteroidetes bacterium GWF2_38_335]|nr:MAG: excinuclease ABC subunit C [Bacteroidetes bacterium GWF2_38_335]OFY77129.1 MAG: excinuclease ABC subunit C [Bacteroidetes bacterium RIFOXYA12_FULL_38_20]HBS85020.1 excinuclease ABC subunit C [Bacteroidales bacterium]
MKIGKCVYILTNKHKNVLYVGVTNDLVNRVLEHRAKKHPHSFTAKYNLFYLMYYEVLPSMQLAIDREKQIKKYSRKRKEELINGTNVEWRDLFEGLSVG